MFKIAKSDLKFAVDLCSIAVSSKRQDAEEYRSIRMETFESGDKHYVAFEANNGFHAVKTTGFEIIDFESAVDCLVDCTKLMDIVNKSTVDLISIKQSDENVIITANGKNKLKFSDSNILPQSPEYDTTKCLGSLSVKEFSKLCNIAKNFVTDDIHKVPLVGLCIENNNLYATDQLKGITLKSIGLNVTQQMNFNSIIADMVNKFGGEETINFYFGKNKGADDFSHLVAEINGIELFVLRYQQEYVTKSLDIVNTMCETKNTQFFVLSKAEALNALGRLSLYADKNDLLALQVTNDELTLEVLDVTSGESGRETLKIQGEVKATMLNKQIYVSFVNFGILLRSLSVEQFKFNFDDDPKFISVVDATFTSWLTTKRMS